MEQALAEEVNNMNIPYTFQIFCTGPRNNKPTLTASDKSFIRDKLQGRIVIHGAYVDFLWNGNPAGVANVNNELRISDEIGATGVVVHLKTIIEDISVLKRLDLGHKSTLWLEINASKPSAYTYEKTDNIRKLFSRINDLNLALKIGFCIDTAHLHSSGCTLSSREQADNWVSDCLQAISVLKNIANPPIMFHLNDSSAAAGTGLDRHTSLFEGNIWSGYKNNKKQSGCSWIIDYCKANNIVCILERDDELINDDIKIIYELF